MEYTKSTIGAAEGYVVRPVDGFMLSDFATKVGKYVRENHVTEEDHWMYKKLEFNGIRNANTTD